MPENCVLRCDNDRCSATVQDGKILIVCPKGESCLFSIEDLDTGLSDTVRVANPGMLFRSGREIERIWYGMSSYVMREGSLGSRIASFLDRHLHGKEF